jgi:homoserine kinase type II
MDSSISSDLREILSHYDLGELVDYEKNERGFVNTAFAIDTLDRGTRRRLFLRKYKRGIHEEELQFEHSLIGHMVACGLPAARIYPTRAGKSYLQRFEGADDAVGVFYTIFDYLPGEDRYTWVDPVLNDAELYASGAVLAQFHIAAGSFTPRGRRMEPKILELLPVIADTWAGCPAKSKGSVFDERIRERLELVGDNLAATMRALGKPQVRTLPEMAIHCDYHPGNLKFTGEAVTGLFDFDWSKIDLRLFDLALALWYFCTSWQGGQDGSFRLDWARTFLRAYQDTLAEALAAHPEATPLSQAEIRYLPVMINAANLYVLNWTILDYFNKDVDPQEYLVFLDHSLNFTLWYEEKRVALEAIL